MRTRITDGPILPGLVQKTMNPILGAALGFLFRKMEFDEESYHRLSDCAVRGALVYGSFQGTAASLVILGLLLKRKGIALPCYALDYNPFFFQRTGHVFRRIVEWFAGTRRGHQRTIAAEDEYIAGGLKQRKSVVISLLSMKFFARRYREAGSDPLLRLIEIQRTIDVPIFIAPQMFFWNRNLEWAGRRPMSSRATGDRGLFSAWLTVTRSITHSFIRVLEPVNLQEVISGSPERDSVLIANRIRTMLLEKYRLEKRIVLGPVRKTSAEMMESTLDHPSILQTIQSIASDEGTSPEQLRKSAIRYYKEITTNQNIIIIRIMEFVLNFIFKKMFSSIIYNVENIPLIKEALRKGPVLIAPSHKSHTDYMLLSYVFYYNRIMLPVICAGSNLAFFPLSVLFRGVGAFFMRRSFKGKALYAAVFKQYVKTLVADGGSIEVFIEGGRSRTGALLYPRAGFLQMMIEAIAEGAAPDISVLPVSINYDRVIEEPSYHDELRAGRKKEDSASMIIQSVKFLNRKHGNVYIMFQKPFSLRAAFEEAKPGTDAAMAVAHRIIDGIYDIGMVTPTALVTTAMLVNSVKGFTLPLVADTARSLHSFLEFSGVRMTDELGDRSTIDRVLMQVIRSYAADRLVEELPLATENDPKQSLFVLKEENRPRIAFYQNTMMHYCIPLAYTALALRRLTAAGLPCGEESLFREYRALQDLFAREFLFAPTADRMKRDFDRTLLFLHMHELITVEDDAIDIATNGFSELAVYARLIQYLVESYAVAFESIAHMQSDGVYLHDFLKAVRRNGVRQYHAGNILLAESLSMPAYTNAVQSMIAAGIITRAEPENRRSPIALADPERADAYLTYIRQYLECCIRYNRGQGSNGDSRMQIMQQPATGHSSAV